MNDHKGRRSIAKRPNERTPDEVIAIIEKRIERIIECLQGISALAEYYRRNIIPSGQNFLFGTVYDALWDTVVVQLGSIWDSNPETASFLYLRQYINSIDGAASIRNEIEKRCRQGKDREILHNHRNRAVAHYERLLDEPAFDENFRLDLDTAWKGVDETLRYLSIINGCLGRTNTFFDDLKDDSKKAASCCIEDWQHGRQARIEASLQAFGLDQKTFTQQPSKKETQSKVNSFSE